MNPIVTMSKGAKYHGIKPYPVLVTGCILSKDGEDILEFELYDAFRKDPKTGQYTLKPEHYFTFNPFAVQINKELQDELTRCNYTMPIDTLPERKPDQIVRRITKENGDMESECPAFMEHWDPEVVECKECAKAFPDEYAQCRRATQIELEKKPVQQEIQAEPVTTTSQVVEPVTQGATKEFKGFRIGSRAQVLLEFFKQKGECSFDEASEHIAKEFKIDKKFSLEGIKSYLSEWTHGKWSGKDQNFPFTIVINNDMIKYTKKED